MSEPRATKISEAKDARNRLVLSHVASSPMARLFNLSAESLLVGGTPEQRDAYVKKIRTWTLLGAALFAAFLLSVDWAKLGADQARPKVLMETNAGKVQSVQLHETALSRTTTIVTTVGTYQVIGAVSVEPGVFATLRREKTLSGETTSVCVESDIKQACYSLL